MQNRTLAWCARTLHILCMVCYSSHIWILCLSLPMRYSRLGHIMQWHRCRDISPFGNSGLLARKCACKHASRILDFLRSSLVVWVNQITFLEKDFSIVFFSSFKRGMSICHTRGNWFTGGSRCLFVSDI